MVCQVSGMKMVFGIESMFLFCDGFISPN